MNGRQVSDAERAIRPSFEIMFVTGYAYDVFYGLGQLGLGMQIVMKPFQIAVLASRIDGTLGKCG